MKEIIRESPFGQILRLVSGNRLLRYPEEEPGYQIPFERLLQVEKERALDAISEKNGSGFQTPIDESQPKEEVEKEEVEEPLPVSTIRTAEDRGPDVDIENARTHELNKLTSVKSVSRTQTLPFTRERMELDQELAAQRALSLPIQPTITSTGQILVTVSIPYVDSF